MKSGTIALLIEFRDQVPVVVDTLSDDQEITLAEAAISEGEVEPLKKVQALRAHQAKEDEEFGNYVEELLSQPFVRPEIQRHGLQWLRSKMRIEQYQRSEREATKVIAEYALQVFRDDPKQTDFVLAGPVAQVRVRILIMRSIIAQAA